MVTGPADRPDASARTGFIRRATLGYATFALVWIFFSDQILASLADMVTITRLSTLKGFFFVLMTAGWFHYVLHRVPDREGPQALAPLLETLAGPHLGRPRRIGLAYGFALGITALTVLVRALLADSFGPSPMVIVFMLPIILSALLGGLGPGLLSTAVGALGANYFVMDPVGSLLIHNPSDLFHWLMLIACGLAIAFMSDSLRRTRAGAEAQRRLLDSVVSGSSDAIFVKDQQGRYLLCNDSAARFLGKEPREVLGHDDNHLFPAAVATTLRARDKSLMDSRRNDVFEETVTNFQGQTTTFLTNRGPVLGQHGEVVGSFGISRDITERKEAEDLLRESESYFRQMLAGLPGLVWSATPDFQWDFASPQWLAYTGRSQDSQLGEGWLAVLHPDHRQMALEVLQQALKAGRDFSTEFRLCRHDGEYRWFSARGTPIRDGAGQVVRWFGICTDIEDQRRIQEALEKSEAHYRTLFEAMNEAFAICEIILDDQGRPQDYRHLTVNPAFERLGGYRPGSVAGRTARELVSEVEPYWVDMFGHTALTGEPTAREDYSAALGKWLDARAFSLGNGRFAYLFTDVSERKEAEAAIVRLNAELEQRVVERTAQLVAANKELEGFTYAASHDLKAPLGRINSFSTLLERKYRDQLDGDGLMFLDLIRRNATRLIALVDDLLAHAQVERQTRELRPVHLPSAVESVLEERSEEIRLGGVVLQLDIPEVRVLADPQALAQVLGNLVENALKYSSRSDPPRVEIGGLVEDGVCRLRIRDNGIGFSMNYRDKIFEIFRRLHTYEEFPGSGIGLALVKKAVERMDGRVWAESLPGEGATFYLELRVAGEDVAEVRERPAA